MTPHDVDAMEDEAMSKSGCEFKKYCRYEGKGDECNDADYQLYCDQKEGFSEMEYDHAGEIIARAKRTKRQNPDPKKYANREELVEELQDCEGTTYHPGKEDETHEIDLWQAINIIRTHGKEE